MTSPTLKPILKATELPDFGPPASPPSPPSAEKLVSRIAAARNAMQAAGLTHLIVYADREHTANLAWATNFDARFEEALLVISEKNDPLLITGNECAGYLAISALHAKGRLRHELFQDFSLLDQSRSESRKLRDILGDEGIGNGARVGAVGWKYFSDPAMLDVPSYLADLLRQMAGLKNVTNATHIFMHAGHGLRCRVEADDVAAFEFANVAASDGMKSIIRGLKEGMTDFEAVANARINGLPLGCHVTFATGANRDLGLTGPTGEIIRRGSPLSFNLSYWRANICRAAWVAHGKQDLPSQAQDYVESFAGPYVAALAQWFAMMKPGTRGGDVQALIDRLLPAKTFGVTLNPGHLIDIDEWVSSPIFPGSNLELQSGMMMQVDIIPSSSVYGSTRMEDGILIADANLQSELKSLAPAVYARCVARRDFMRNAIGLPVPDTVLPLSNLAGVVQPFLLAPHQVIALA
jgi:Xaa-Pro aminopeptidase